MARYDNFHSRLVAWMKIILPMAALGLLSTLFLISRTVDPGKSVPVSQIDLEKRAHDLGATNPTFAGVTRGGDQIMVRAATARPAPDDAAGLRADGVTANIRLTAGGAIDIQADHADLRQNDGTARLQGNVSVVTTTGYTISTDTLTARIDRLRAETAGAVTGTGPPGELTAGRMILSDGDTPGAAQLLFTDGVKLIYRPDRPKD
ncbi:LPS export ABC transporter periplasmic protein LptC [Roseovarius sp. SYSU LYC5161]|uniref:LPS export ABC transporter periplasmic protein LptC n=1 Tax=Roseovarius halophilus (ex Wu et al. 2025) TaxID=3376060 RepID=UPI002871B5E9|nr:LPS export ABC transporter periplasmic protein LptC [Roseovarius sp.]